MQSVINSVQKFTSVNNNATSYSIVIYVTGDQTGKTIYIQGFTGGGTLYIYGNANGRVLAEMMNIGGNSLQSIIIGNSSYSTFVGNVVIRGNPCIVNLENCTVGNYLRVYWQSTVNLENISILSLENEGMVWLYGTGNNIANIYNTGYLYIYETASLTPPVIHKQGALIDNRPGNPLDTFVRKVNEQKFITEVVAGNEYNLYGNIYYQRFTGSLVPTGTGSIYLLAGGATGIVRAEGMINNNFFGGYLSFGSTDYARLYWDEPSGEMWIGGNKSNEGAWSFDILVYYTK